MIQTSSVSGAPGFTFSSTGVFTHGRSSGAAQTMTIFKNGTSNVGEIRTSTTATQFITSSDYRLKENVTSITDGIVRLKQLKPYRFNFIADGDTTLDGFLAHETQTVVPESVSGTKDENGAPQGPKWIPKGSQNPSKIELGAPWGADGPQRAPK